MTDIYTSNGELRPLIAIDTETYLATQNRGAPRLVCGTIACFGRFPLPIWKILDAGGALIESRGGDGVGNAPEHDVALADADTITRVFEEVLRSADVTFDEDAPVMVGQNFAYDCGVLLAHAHLMELRGDEDPGYEATLHEKLLHAMDLDGTGLPDSESLVMDTLYRELLIRNACGEMLERGSSLADLTKKYLGVDRSEDKKGTPCSKCNATGKVQTFHPAIRGKLSKEVCPKCAGAKYSKPWRLRYCELDGVPFDRWPRKAIDYAMDDAMDTLLVAIAQGGDFGTEDIVGTSEAIVTERGSVRCEAYEVRAAWALKLSSLNGPRSNADTLAGWAEVMEGLVQEGLEIGQQAGFIRDNGSKNTKVLKQMVEDAYAERGEAPPQTPKGAVKTDEKTILGSGDKVLISWIRSGEGRQAQSKFIPAAETGVSYAVSSSPGVLKSTDRTSWSKPAFHQPPRKEGFRECWEARPGNVYCSADWSGAEMVAMGQIQLLMFGTSAMADAINEGKDLHIMVAVSFHNQMYGKPRTETCTACEGEECVEQAVEAGDGDMVFEMVECRLCGGKGTIDFLADQVDYDEGLRRYKEGKAGGDEDDMWAGGQGHRQLGKIANFGFMGGMVAHTFVDYADGYGVVIDDDQAQRVRDAWLETWAEMGDYLDFFRALSAGDGFVYASWVSGFLRGGVRYTNGCNHGFQSIIGLTLKVALWWATKEMYCRSFGSPGGPYDAKILWEYPHSVGDPETPREIEISLPSASGGPSPLFGYRSWLSIHDEILTEGPEQGAHEAAMRLQWLMESALSVMTPDLNTEAEPALMRRWSKGAKTVFEDGCLIPWEDA